MAEKYYAVKVGRTPGVYNDNVEAHDQIYRFPGGIMKGFDNLLEAERFIGIGLTSYFPPHRRVFSSFSEVGNFLPVYVDGVCLGNGGDDAVGGFGVYFGGKDRRNRLGSLDSFHDTNSRADLTAVLRAIQVAADEEIPSNTLRRPLVIHTKSTYAINCLETWYPTWSTNGWKNRYGGPVANQDLIKAIMDEIVESKLYVTFKHVSIASSNIGIANANAFAKRAADLAMKKSEAEPHFVRTCWITPR